MVTSEKKNANGGAESTPFIEIGKERKGILNADAFKYIKLKRI